MRSGTPRIASLGRTLAMLEAVLEDGGHSNVSALARAIAMPLATAHRQVATLVTEGYLQPVGGGRHVAGVRLRALVRHISDWHDIAAISRPILRGGAAKLRCVAHLGILQDAMVTYLVREGLTEGAVFTREGSQLEAYCSALGKVLLAHLPADQRSAYLGSGPFIALTAATITDPDRVREELDRVTETGIAWDREEIAEGLICCAAPIETPGRGVVAAVSLSFEREAYLALGQTAIIKAASGLARRIAQAAVIHGSAASGAR